MRRSITVIMPRQTRPIVTLTCPTMLLLIRSTHATPSSQTGNPIEKYKYDAFGAPTFLDGNGNPLNPNSTLYNNRFLFTGREYAATYRGTYVSTFSFYEYRARAYNPTLGRFMSEDPKLFDAGDYNLFRYCNNDPIDMTDPMGTDDQIWMRTTEREAAWSNSKNGGDAVWAMAKWADSSNNFQGAFMQFAAGQGLTIGQTSRTGPSPLKLWESPTPVVGGTFADRQSMRKEVRRVRETPRGKELVKLIRERGEQKFIHVSKGLNDAFTDRPFGNNIYIDPNFHPEIRTTVGLQHASTARLIGHELGHAVTGLGQREIPFGAMDNVIMNENPIVNALQPPEPSRIEY
jgi:RHS repeat-associated protein